MYFKFFYISEILDVLFLHPEGFEPPTARFVAEYSIQLSYGCKKYDEFYELKINYKISVREGFEPSMQNFLHTPLAGERL